MRAIAITDVFDRKLFKFLKQHAELKDKILVMFSILEKDVNSLSLHTHKLHGKLNKSFACSINFQYRLVFTYDDKFIYPQSIGSHEDVY